MNSGANKHAARRGMPDGWEAGHRPRKKDPQEAPDENREPLVQRAGLPPSAAGPAGTPRVVNAP